MIVCTSNIYDFQENANRKIIAAVQCARRIEGLLHHLNISGHIVNYRYSLSFTSHPFKTRAYRLVYSAVHCACRVAAT